MSQKSHYYYLISSLYDLIIDDHKKPLSMNTFYEFCREELSVEDFTEFKKIFLMNDIKNAVSWKKDGARYLTPSYYSQEEFAENLAETDNFFKFLKIFYNNKAEEKRIQPEILEIDELVKLFYEDLENIAKAGGFIYDYFLFELNLRNILTGLSGRKNKTDFANRIIKFGGRAEDIIKNASGDFGLGREVDFIDQLVQSYDTGEIIKIERTVDDIRWNWLDARIVDDIFSFEAVLSYAVKLQTVLRWYELNDEKGKEILDKLLNQIKETIKFQDEFLTIGGK